MAHSAHVHTPPLPVLEQLRGSHLADSLASRGAACEVSHESTISAMLCAPNVASIAHALPPHMGPQVSSALPAMFCFIVGACIMISNFLGMSATLSLSALPCKTMTNILGFFVPGFARLRYIASICVAIGHYQCCPFCLGFFFNHLRS